VAPDRGSANTELRRKAVEFIGLVGQEVAPSQTEAVPDRVVNIHCHGNPADLPRYPGEPSSTGRVGDPAASCLLAAFAWLANRLLEAVTLLTMRT
jgi:hypothetical protein